MLWSNSIEANLTSVLWRCCVRPYSGGSAGTMSAFGGKADIAAKLLTRDEARLQLHRGFTDADLDDAVRAALTGLVQLVA